MTTEDKKVILGNSLLSAFGGAAVGGLLGGSPEQKVELAVFLSTFMFFAIAFIDWVKTQ